jgi:integrase
MRLKRGESGKVVRTRDTDQGPLTEEELNNLTLDIYKASEEKLINLEDLSLAVFHIVAGRRSIQSAGLKCKDVDGNRKGDPEPGQKEGKRLLMLHVPRAKQVGHHFRKTRRSIYLIQTYFTLFETQRDTVQDKFNKILEVHGFSLQPEDLRYFSEELPLYPDWLNVEDSLIAAASLREQGQHGQALTALRVHASGDFWHLNAKQISRRLGRIAEQAGTRSREGEPLILSAQRLRYTRGTELARLGVGLETLAWLLDHSTIDTAGVYIDNLAEHAAQINEAMSGSMALQHFASLFRGDVVDDEVHALAGDDPHHSRVHYKGVGAATCGIRKQCGMGGGIPRACYTCDRFQPWLNGPHEIVLYDLLEERKREGELLSSDHPVTIRRDKTIFAVINVIQRCEARRAELSSQASEDGSS